MIILKPTGGLCNRMRAISAAESLALAAGRPLKIIWERNQWLNCRFAALFKPVKSFTVKDTHPDIRYNTAHHSAYGFARRSLHRLLNGWMFSKAYFESPIGHNIPVSEKLLQEIKHKKKIYISASHSFFPGGHYASFQPVSELQTAINNTAASFGENICGLHLRRTDHVHSITESPDELFVQVIDKALAVNSSAQFFLATDAPETEQFFTKRFGKALIIHPKTFGRNSQQGIKDAVIDLYLLSRTKKLCASYQSSFSETAAAIGNIPLQVLRQGAV